MAHVWTIEINESAVNYESIDFDRTYNNPDPTEFTAIVEYNSNIDYWQTVAIKNNGTIEWYGYIEDIKPIWSETGLALHLWGRDRLVIAWKKFTDRYSDTRLDGFFGAVDPAKLIHFLLRCPISDDPTTSNLSKIGWGLDPTDWVPTGSSTSIGRDAKWVQLRRQGLAWELGPRYSIHEELIDNFYAEKTNWDVVGGSRPDILDDKDYFSYIQSKYYSLLTSNALSGQANAIVANSSQFSIGESVRISVHADTGVHGGTHEVKTIQNIVGNTLTFSSNLSNNYYTADGSGVLKRTGLMDSWYEMDDLGVSNGKITEAYVYVYGRHYRSSWGSGTYPDAKVKIYVYDGSSWDSGTEITWTDGEYGYGGWCNVLKIVNISSFINTFAKVNACRVKIEFTGTDATQSSARIGEIKLIVSGYAYQTTGDYFKVDLGEEKNRITGIYVESRMNSDKYARNYSIQTSQNGSDWTARASKSSNLARDIIESWAPVDNIRYVRIYITSNANFGWEISQIYVYQADVKQYRVLNEGSGTVAPQVLGAVSLGTTYVATNGTLKPLNLGFTRLSHNIVEICNKSHDVNYDTWEFYIDHNDGEFHFAARKGQDKSATITFETKDEIGGVTKEGDTRGCTTRVKVVGKSEGKTQDDVTSDWQINSAGEATIGSFYEKIITDKSISDKETADVVANVEARLNGDVEETFEVKIAKDEYSPMAYDVGDDVTVTDVLSGASGSYRLRGLHKHIGPDNGEEITLYVGTRWKDVSDQMAEIQRLIRSISASGTTMTDWFAEGGAQNKISSDKLTDIWDKTATNDESDPPSDKTDSNWINKTGDGSNSQELQCTENWFFVKGSKDVGTQHTLTAIAANDEGEGIKFNQNPKFVTTVKILDEGTNPSSGATDWNEEDSCDIFMTNNDVLGAGWRAIGFYIIFRNGIYQLWFGVVDAGGQNWKRAEITGAGTQISITTNQKYRLEARIKWRDEDGNVLTTKYAEFYFADETMTDLELIGVIPFSVSEGGTSKVYPVGIHLTTSQPSASVQTWAQLYFYKWKTEWSWG